MFAVQANGADIRTIEGMAAADGTLHALQEGFREMHGLQCGFCTPGMIVRAYRLLQENKNPTEEEIRFGISGNLCRCTGYQNIVKAIQFAAAKLGGVPHAGGRRMNEMTPTSEQRAEKPAGHGLQAQAGRGCPLRPGQGQLRRRPEAAGNALRRLRPLAARATPASRAIDTAKAKAVPGVLAVLTAADLKPLNLHYMPTLAGDVQAVLAEEKVLFQNQEVAFVIAEDRYAAADAADLVEVEYEALPVIVDPFKAMAPDAPVLREDIKGKTEGAHGDRKHHNHVFTWEIGDKSGTDAAFRKAEVTIKELISYQRVHPCPLETCQCVASFDKIKGELTVWGTFQAPHVIRTVASLISKIPEHKIHVIAPDIGGGFGNKVGAYSGYICAIVASIVTGRPVKWVEDRIENLSTTAFARDYHMTAEIAATKDGKVTGLRVYTIADHGAFDACADPTKWPAGFFNIVTGLLRFPGRARDGRRRLFEQGAGRRRLPLLVPRHRSGLLHRAGHGHHGAEARTWTRPSSG